MSKRLKELREKEAELVAKARAKMDEIKDDTSEARAKEIEAEYDAIIADADKANTEADALEARLKKQDELAEREREQEERARRPDPRRPSNDPSPADEGVRKREAAARRAAFQGYLRHGMEGLSRDQRALLVREPDAEQRAQGVASATAGGFLVPEGFMPELIVSMALYGPMLNAAIVRALDTATGASIPWPTMDDTSNTGAIIAENTQVSSTEVTFGVRTLGAYKYTSNVVLVANELLQDSTLDVETIVRNAMAERIGRIGNTHLTTGDAASKPNGIMNAAGAGATAASSTAIVFDDLINLEHSVDPMYRSDPSCRWMFNDNTLKAIRKLKDGEGRYIWQPADVQAGAPRTILGYPYSINQAVADIATTAKSAAFGAFNRYVRRVVNQFAIRRLNERYADYDQVGFIGFARLDGNLMDAGAVKRLVHP
jgi:HK97 family phage major capsid protein